MKTAKCSNFRSGRGTFPITSPSADAYLYKGTHCVSGFRDYVSEGGTDTYPNFWKRFSPTVNKANLEDHFIFGPVIVDLTSPTCTCQIDVAIEEEAVVFQWSKDCCLDNEDSRPLTDYLWSIGNLVLYCALGCRPDGLIKTCGHHDCILILMYFLAMVMYM